MFLDSPGKQGTLPYASDFLEKYIDDYCYDRFWDEKVPEHVWNTRYLCCGYGFTAIGEYENKDGSLSFFMNQILSHFRNHYFQMGLLAHFHRASLLVFSNLLAQAASFIRKSQKKFRKKIHRIHQDLVRFTHRYWFTEISNQIQPTEMFSWWSYHLKTDALYKRVMRQANESSQLLNMERQNKINESSHNLNIIAVFGVTLSIAIAFLSINILSDELKDVLPENDWIKFFIVLGFVSIPFVIWLLVQMAKSILKK